MMGREWKIDWGGDAGGAKPTDVAATASFGSFSVHCSAHGLSIGEEEYCSGRHCSRRKAGRHHWYAAAKGSGRVGDIAPEWGREFLEAASAPAVLTSGGFKGPLLMMMRSDTRCRDITCGRESLRRCLGADRGSGDEWLRPSGRSDKPPS